MVALLLTISINLDVFHHHQNDFESHQDCIACQLYSALLTVVLIVFIFVYEYVRTFFSIQHPNKFTYFNYNLVRTPRAPPL